MTSQGAVTCCLGTTGTVAASGRSDHAVQPDWSYDSCHMKAMCQKYVTTSNKPERRPEEKHVIGGELLVFPPEAVQQL